MAGKLSGAVTAQDFPNSSPVNDPIKTPKLAGAKDYRDYSEFSSDITSSIPRQQFVGSTGVGESQFDSNIPISQLDRLGEIRAIRQPWTHQAGNAILGGITSGALTAIEDVGYILDLPNNIKSSIYSDVIGNRVENVESNWLSDWAKDNKEALNAALPIYRKDPSDTFDWNDSGFYFDMLKGVLDSAIGFGAVGMGSGALVKGLGKGIRALSKMGDINKLNAYMNITGKAIQQGKVGNASAAYITNFGESKMMALELYDEARNNVESELVNQYLEQNGVAPEGKELQSIQLKASDIAGKEANTFMLRNKMFMLTDYMQLGSIFKASTNGLTRQKLARSPEFWNRVGDFWKTQAKTAPKEALEEIGQNVLQMEGKYQAEQELDKQFGIKVDEAISNETNWVNRFIEFGTSDQALLEGMMGLISGPIQYAVTTAPFQNTKEENKRYTNQQQTLAKNKEYFDTKAKVITDKTKAIEEAVANGQYEIAELIEQKQFDSLLLENFQRGTTEQLETGLIEMLNEPDTTPEVKEKIETNLKRLTELENEYNTNFRKYSNGVEVFNNRLQVRHDKKGLELLNQNNERFIQDLTDELSIPIESHNKTKQGKANPVSFSEVLEAVRTRDLTTLNNLPASIKKLVSKSANAQRLDVLNNRDIPALQQRIVDNNNEYNEAVTTPYQLGYERMQDILENFKTTEEKITELNKLEKDVKATKNDTLINRVKRERATLEANVQAAKDKDAQGNKEPETIKAEANAKKPTTKTTVTTPVVETKPTITPEDKQQVDIVRRANIMAAKLAADNEALAQIEALTDEEFLADIKANPDLVQAAQQQLDEWANISAEEKEAIKNGIKPVTLGEDTKVQTPVEEVDNTPSIDSVIGSQVSYQGKLFTVAKEGSKYILENNNLIVELEAEPESTIKSLKIEQINKPEEIKKYNVSILNEGEVNVNGTTYLIQLDNKGNVIGLNPTNRPDQTIKNEALLIAVEVERNKFDYNNITEQLVNDNKYEEIKSNHIELEFVEGIYGKNWNSTVGNALDKLYADQPLTQSERLALDLWVTDAIIELTKLYTKNPNLTYANALDNLEIINILLYDGNNQKYQRQEVTEASPSKPTKKRTPKVTKPKESKLNKEPEVTDQPVTETPLETIPAEELFGDDIPQTELPQVETPVITVEPISQVKEEIQINENPNSPEVEVRNYNSETNIVHEDLNKEDNSTVDKFEQSHVKISNPPRNKNLSQEALNFLDWLENGVNPTGSLVEYQVSTGISPANRTAYNTFTKLQRGEQVSTEDKKFMVDNLSISLNPQGISNAKTFLFDVREGKTEDSKRAAKLERKLRTQIIANLLEGVTPTSTVVAQYGGDLKVTEVDVPITDIPDFRNMKADDIQFMYVNGEGNLMDANTREITTNPKFINKKITLKSTSQPMAGAIFTIVRKANGDQFPLKLNIKELSTKEIDLVTQLLMDIVTVNGGKQNNILAKPVEDVLLSMMDVNDRNYLSENGKKSITYSMALSHLVYEGDRSKSNPVTQLLFKNGKVIFGNQELTLDNFLETQSKLKEFLAQYKTRNIDLRKMSNDINYKRHVINNGLLTTNTDTATSKATLFESLDLQANYKSVGERMTNRYKSATIYVEPSITNPVEAKKDVVVKVTKPVLEVSPEVSSIVSELAVDPIQEAANAKLEENKENMTVSNIINSKRDSSEVSDKLNVAIGKIGKSKKKSADKNNPTKKCDQ